MKLIKFQSNNSDRRKYVNVNILLQFTIRAETPLIVS